MREFSKILNVCVSLSATWPTKSSSHHFTTLDTSRSKNNHRWQICLQLHYFYNCVQKWTTFVTAWCNIHSITQILTKSASFFWIFYSEGKSAVGPRSLPLYQLKYLINQHVQITDLQKHKTWLLMFLFILLMCNPLKLQLIITVDFLVSFSNAQHSGYCLIFMQLYPCPRHQIRGQISISFSGWRKNLFFCCSA